MYSLLKKTMLLIVAIVITSSVSFSQNDDMKMPHESSNEKTTEKSSEPVGVKTDDGMLYGKSIDPKMTITEYADLMKDPNASNETVVVVRGNVSEVCQSMGCWMVLSDGTNNTRVKTGHEYLLPKDIAGQNAIVYGTFKVTEISEDDAKHYNEETKNPNVKTEDIRGPQKAFELEATGILILSPDAAPAKE
jgi:hypothetical protein